MKLINGEEYLKIGEVADIIDRSPLTIKNWYEWAELNKAMDLLPEVKRIGPREIRYYKKSDIFKLIKFKNNITYGSMSEFNETKWGDRGITKKRTTPFNHHE